MIHPNASEIPSRSIQFDFQLRCPAMVNKDHDVNMENPLSSVTMSCDNRKAINSSGGRVGGCSNSRIVSVVKMAVFCIAMVMQATKPGCRIRRRRFGRGERNRMMRNPRVNAIRIGIPRKNIVKKSKFDNEYR